MKENEEEPEKVLKVDGNNLGFFTKLSLAHTPLFSVVRGQGFNFQVI